jgi:hypothetical protein
MVSTLFKKGKNNMVISTPKKSFAKRLTNNRRKDFGSQDSRDLEFTGPKETVEEFLARGGEITICPPRLAPDVMPGDPPRREFDAKDMYKI